MADQYRIVVVDDLRDPASHSFCAVELHRTLSDGLAALQTAHATGQHIDELWLDHDLGYNPEAEFGWDTIMPIVDWLEEIGYNGSPLLVDHIYVHTSNPAAAPRMIDALKKYYDVTRAELPLEESK